MIKENQVQEGAAFSYYNEDEEKLGTVTAVTVNGRFKTVILDNGDKIPMHTFMASADPVLSSFNEEEELHIEKNSDAPSMQIQLKNGIPVLGTAKPIKAGEKSTEHGMEMDSSLVVTPEQYEKENKHPVIALLEKAKTTKTELVIKLDVDIIDKQLFDILNSSFPDATTNIIRFFTERITQKLLKDKVREELSKHYGIASKS